MSSTPRLSRLALGFSLLALATCTTKERPAWPNGAPEVDTIKTLPGVVTVPAAMTNVAKVTKDSLTFPVEMAGEVMANWPAGKVVVGSPAQDMSGKRSNPFGFLRKVTGTRIEGNSVIVDTEIAKLDEAIGGSFRKDLDFGSMTPIDLPPDTDLSAYDVPVPLAGIGKGFPDFSSYTGLADAGSTSQPLDGLPAPAGPVGHLYGQKRQPLSVGLDFSVPETPITALNITTPLSIPSAPGEFVDVRATVVLTPRIRFAPRLTMDYDASIVPPRLNWVEYKVGGARTLGFNYDVNVSALRRPGTSSLTELALLAVIKSRPLEFEFEVPLPFERLYTFNLGPVPMVSTTKAFILCKAKFEGAVQVRGSVVQTGETEGGVRWDRTSPYWRPIVNVGGLEPPVTGDVLGGEAGVELDCGVVLRSDVRAAGIAGPYAQVRADIVGTAKVQEECPVPDPAPASHPANVKIDLGVKAYLALQVGVDSVKLFKGLPIAIALDYGPYDVWRKNFIEGPLVTKPNPYYTGTCLPFYCPPPTVTEPEWKDIRSWSFTRVNAGRGRPDAGVWCVVPCADGRKNGSESDVDCGGATCSRCSAAKTCLSNSDCASGTCSAAGQCVASLCEDGVRGQQETDVDCGGPTCRPCPPVRSDGSPTTCSADRDCAAPFFCSNDGTTPRVCTDNSCRDGRRSGSEPDVDCGAVPGCTSLCAVTKGCSTDADCTSGACNLVTRVCVTSTCFDGRLDGDEADVDCGGSCAAKCSLTQACSYVTRQNADCQSNICSHPGFGTRDGFCVASTCTDQRVDGSETGLDCGGPAAACATRCPIGQSCRVTTDCVSGSLCHPRTLRCALPGCDDGVLNGAETSTDCGGPMCVKCGVGKTCSLASDCVSGSCANGQCISGPCFNGVKDATEADVDCGGVCGAQACGTGRSCTVPSDCASNLCVGNRCVSDACLDRVRNGTETDVDCGGSTCAARCAASRGCAVNGDCASNVCNTGSRTCVAGPCEDGVLTVGSETDVDCGGTCGATNASRRCAVNRRCAGNTDCASGVCNATTLRCVPNQCFDGVRNGSETDVDCGGSCEPKCAATRVCAVNTDCQSGACGGTNRCAADQCSDGRLNGSESAIDCGGTCVTKCAVGQPCASGVDCVHPQMLVGVPGFCHAVTNTCAATSCTDGLLDGDETGVDCGGSCAAKCALGLGCLAGADCASTFCNATTRVCVASQCLDGVTNGTETDVDCGGSCGDGATTFAQCTVGRGCTRPWDCASGYCGAGGTCILPIPRNCAVIFDRNGPTDRQNRTYVIDPDGPNRIGSRPETGWNPPFATFCRNQDEGTGIDSVTGARPGGWTPVMFLNSMNLFGGAGPDFAYAASCLQNCGGNMYLGGQQPLHYVDQCSTSVNFDCSRSGGGQCLSDATGSTCTQAGPVYSPSNPGCHCLRDSRNWPADPAPQPPANLNYVVGGVAPGLTQDPINWSAAGQSYQTPGTSMPRSFQLQLGGGAPGSQNFVAGFSNGGPIALRMMVYRAGTLVFDSKPFWAAPTLNSAQVVGGVPQSASTCMNGCPVSWAEGEFAAPYFNNTRWGWCRAGNSFDGYIPPNLTNLISLVDEPIPSQFPYASRNAFIQSGYSDYNNINSVRTESAACKGFGANLLRPNPTGNQNHSGLRFFVNGQNGSTLGIEVLGVTRFLPSPNLADATGLINPNQPTVKPGFKGLWWGDFGDASNPRYGPFTGPSYNYMIRNGWIGFCNAMNQPTSGGRNVTCDPAQYPTGSAYTPTAPELNLNNVNGQNSGTMLSQSSGLVVVLWAQ